MKGATENQGAAAPTAQQEGPVVIVDDDPHDALFTESVIDELDPKFPIQILTSGEDLIAYLAGEGLYHDRRQYPYPGIVLLDLKMPRMDGFAVLEWLKEHPEHKDVTIVVLSGYADIASQVTRAGQMGAHSFLPKPIQQKDVEGILSLLNISV